MHFTFASSHGAGGGHCGGARNIRKGIAVPTMLSAKYCIYSMKLLLTLGAHAQRGLQ